MPIRSALPEDKKERHRILLEVLKGNEARFVKDGKKMIIKSMSQEQVEKLNLHL